ncbi:bifunctional pyr operon transcriptional regulator/uracil phosphoribosyltransferase PyrR [Ruoffia tabacinasalis]|uniref:Bifunctional protein PyrR n=1 Tax=Ruoffia tabacinasalis TaxID=87458 RepID=A0ABS0LIZ8_9LACT|nr:bifunctional pyr operon transcriptional regulator/uracil phosphoribosyltransferase PyrR [Ruoffia tabacinasalis]MBG9978271.1 bifunctional pyr operon transcriptional regulator/uracil phosphoribosyltransferase PyrR [Ruoffia tabacinasalis]
MTKRELMNAEGIQRTLKRIAHEILEKNKSTDNLVILGIKTRGEFLAKRVQEKIEEIEGIKLPLEILDITFYRDDLTKKSVSPQVQPVTFISDLTDKKVVVIDDVLFTGRTVRAAMDAILENARPSHIQLAVLVDRGHRELPIRPDFVGKNVPTAKNEQVKVELEEVDGRDGVNILDM